MATPFCLLAGLAALCCPAHAEMKCGDPSEVIAHFDENYQETIAEAGVTTTGGLVVVLAPPGRETWTIVIMRPGGEACLVAAGTDWRNESTPPEPDD